MNPNRIGATALDKCIRSANAVRIEPGRYTVILEPQAVADLLTTMMWPGGSNTDRTWAEKMLGPFQYQGMRSKIGQRVIDARLTIRSDPMDPDAGFVPFDRDSGDPYQSVSWIADGYLRELAYSRFYAVRRLNKPMPLSLSGADRLSTNTPPVSVDTMIRSTKRGLLVTRFHGVEQLDDKSVLCAGYTRDGVWLIEDGKITKPVKNFRFTESPLFILNKVDQIGEPVRVFDPDFARVAPPIKVHDFSFTSLADAV